MVVVVIEWATPFKIHKPPVEDFGKVYRRECELEDLEKCTPGSVNFQMHLYFCEIFWLGLSQSKYFI